MSHTVTGKILYATSSEPECIQDITIQADYTSEALKLFRIVITSIFENSSPICKGVDLYYNKKDLDSAVLKFFLVGKICLKLEGGFTLGGTGESSQGLLKCIRRLSINSLKIPDELIVGNPDEIIHITKTFH